MTTPRCGIHTLARAAAGLLLVVSLALAAGPTQRARADDPPVPWPLPGSPPLPPDLTVPYLPAVNPLCPEGSISCFLELDAILQLKTKTLGCSHDAVFPSAYVTITEALIRASETPGYFERPDRINHEARQYAQEYLDQYQRWHAGDVASVSPAWAIAFQASADQSVTALGDLLLQLNAHIRRDNAIRAIEQSEGVLRVEGDMPAASGRYDHDRVSDVLQNTLKRMLTRLARRYDPTIDDGAQLFGMVLDPKGLYALISSWREEAWRNAEQLRHARALGGVDGPLYQAKLAEIEDSARVGAEVIRLATQTTPLQNAQRNAYCAAHVH
jgi:Family of unknown function (DUF5995)